MATPGARKRSVARLSCRPAHTRATLQPPARDSTQRRCVRGRRRSRARPAPQAQARAALGQRCESATHRPCPRRPPRGRTPSSPRPPCRPPWRPPAERRTGSGSGEWGVPDKSGGAHRRAPWLPGHRPRSAPSWSASSRCAARWTRRVAALTRLHLRPCAPRALRAPPLPPLTCCAPQIWAKITELDLERQEHALVLETLTPLEAERRCFRLVGGVLVERTVGEVAPAVTRNREALEEVRRQRRGACGGGRSAADAAALTRR
jgi:hypothetical protein